MVSSSCFPDHSDLAAPKLTSWKVETQLFCGGTEIGHVKINLPNTLFAFAIVIDSLKVSFAKESNDSRAIYKQTGAGIMITRNINTSVHRILLMKFCLSSLMS